MDKLHGPEVDKEPSLYHHELHGAGRVPYVGAGVCVYPLCWQMRKWGGAGEGVSSLGVVTGVGTGGGYLPHLGSSAKVSLSHTARIGKHTVCASHRLWRSRDVVCNICILKQ